MLGFRVQTHLGRVVGALSIIIVSLVGCGESTEGESESESKGADSKSSVNESTSLASKDRAPPAKKQRTGKQLYATYCAVCHGISGDGQGDAILEQAPRDFAEGGFAFGNTKEALFKVITVGMPGSSKMPGFKNTLSDDERWLVVHHLATLMPEASESELRETLVEISDQPVLVRGHLGAGEGGGREIPRGLLIGDPDGLSFIYDLDQCVLKSVRWGGLVDRTDWNGRGGSQLRPVGEFLYGLSLPSHGSSFTTQAGRAMELSLKSTWNDGLHGGITYQLSDENSRVLVDESNRVEGLSSGSGFTRSLVFSGESMSTLRWNVDRGSDSSTWAFGRPDDSWSGRSLWMVRNEGDAKNVIFFVRGDRDLKWVGDDHLMAFDLTAEMEAPSTVEVTVIPSPEWSQATLTRLQKEMGV